MQVPGQPAQTQPYPVAYPANPQVIPGQQYPTAYPANPQAYPANPQAYPANPQGQPPANPANPQNPPPYPGNTQDGAPPIGFAVAGAHPAPDGQVSVCGIINECVCYYMC